MRTDIAVIADVHANYPALAAALAAIADCGIEHGLCAGDLVLRGGQPQSCVAALRRLGWRTASGNTDRTVARKPRTPPAPSGLRVGARHWTRRHLSGESLAYLAALSSVVRLDIGGVRIAVTHGAPTADHDVIDEHTDDDRLVDLAEWLGADCVVSGHTHVPLVRRAEGRLFVNPGSVGESRGPDRRPRWARLTIEDGRISASLEAVPAPLTNLRLPATHRLPTPQIA